MSITSDAPQSIALDYDAACSAAHSLTMRDGEFEIEVPFPIVEDVTRLCPLPARQGNLYAEVQVWGGLGCCGDTTIHRLEAVPARGDAWDAQRCSYLWNGLAAASLLGVDAMREFVTSVVDL